MYNNNIDSGQPDQLELVERYTVFRKIPYSILLAVGAILFSNNIARRMMPHHSLGRNHFLTFFQLLGLCCGKALQ